MLRKATIQELVAAFLNPRQLKPPLDNEDPNDERERETRQREQVIRADH